MQKLLSVNGSFALVEFKVLKMTALKSVNLFQR